MRYFDELIYIFSSINDPILMEKLFNELFTKKEILDLTKRIGSLKKLHAGETQRKISSELGISLCKITRGSKILKNDSSVLKKILDEKQ